MVAPDLRGLIGIKRDGGSWSAADVSELAAAICDGRLDDAQLGALAMAAYIQGLSADETAALTLATARSGHTLKWDRTRLRGPVVDKHSTGGVGDTVSLLLGPMLAAVDCHVPMLSGRGLGLTGGTLDKLESIPGYDCQPTPARFRQIVTDVGLAIASAGDLAPADRRLYAVRDATSTVAAPSLITASILGKKLAEDLDALVLDVKYGVGALCQDIAAARELSGALLAVAGRVGLPTRSLITAMNEPLGPAAGNALEVRLAVRCLTGVEHPQRLVAVTLSLGAAVLEAAGATDRIDRFRSSLHDGQAAERFGRMVAAMGGPPDLMEHPNRYLPLAPVCLPVLATRSGIVRTVDARVVGTAVHQLGGGRCRSDDAIDHAVGVTELVATGDQIEVGQPLAWIHARRPGEADMARRRLIDAFTVDTRTAAAGGRQRHPPETAS